MIKPTDRTQVKRGIKNASYDKKAIYQIIDEAFVCHIGGTIHGFPAVQPNLHWRVGDTLYIHGSRGNALINSILKDEKTCITISLLDGLVLAKSAFRHSVNYRSVMIFGKPGIVENNEEKALLLNSLVEKCQKGRSMACRPATIDELKTTTVISIPINEVSAKIRTGGPNDNPEDLDLDYWAGVIPLTMVYGEPIEHIL